MHHKLIAAAAWVTLAFIAAVTLSPLALRPEVGDTNLERFAAYALVGFLFVVAYPRHFILTAIFIVCVAAFLEALQLLTHDRHGEFADAAVKAAGGLFGTTVARVVLRLTAADR
jgi:hypothetical protein